MEKQWADCELMKPKETKRSDWNSDVCAELANPWAGISR